MNRLSQRALATLAAIGVLLAPVAAQTPAPAAPAAPRKLISPQRGDANIEITKPDTKVTGTEVLTIILVKNVSPAPIAGFKVEENWYDKAGNPVGGGIYRHPKPLMPNEVIRVELRTPQEPEDEHQPVPVHARQRLGEAQGGAEAGRRARDELDSSRRSRIGECREQRHSPRLCPATPSAPAPATTRPRRQPDHVPRGLDDLVHLVSTGAGPRR